MKNLVDILNANNIILKKIEKIDLVNLGSRQKIDLFSGVDEAKYYTAMFLVANKSRFVKSSAIKLMELEKRLEIYVNHIYKNKVLIITSPLCSKAKLFLKEDKWKIIEVENVTV